MSLPKNRVKLVVAYDSSLLAPQPHEFAPFLASWTSFAPAKNAERSLTAKSISPGVDSWSRPVTIEFDMADPANMRADDAVWFEAYALEPNKTGDHVANRVGSGFLYLTDIHKLSRKPKPPRGTALATLELSLFNYWTEKGTRLVKGRLAVLEASMPKTYKPPPADQCDAFAYLPSQNAFLQSESERTIGMHITMFTDEGIADGNGMEPLDPKDRRVHAPAWNAPSGWKAGFTYFIKPGNRAPKDIKSGEKYMLNLFTSVLGRNNMTWKTFRSIVIEQLKRTDDTYDERFTKCCAILGEAMCAAAVSMPYIGDTINTAARMRAGNGGFLSGNKMSTHGVESFDWAQFRGGGDCEDFARLIHAHLTALADGAWESRNLRTAQALARCYVGLGTLSSVLGAQLSDADRARHDDLFVLGTRRDNNVEIGAHMYHQMLPWHKFATFIRRAVPNVDIDSIMSEHAPRAQWTEKMPHLVLEGTGRLDPLLRPAMSYAVTREGKQAARKLSAEKRRLVAHIGTHANANFRGRQANLLALCEVARTQKQLERTPNARYSSFYRNNTHSFSDELLKLGFSCASFTWAAIGEVDLVPANSSRTYADDPMIQSQQTVSAKEDSSSEEDDIGSQWSALGASLAKDTIFGDDGDDDNDSVDTQTTQDSVAAVATAAAWRRPVNLSTEQLLLGARAAHASERFDTFNYNETPDEPMRYGIPLTTALEDRPTRKHVGLLPAAPLDSISAAAIATYLRHSKPIPAAGDLRAAREFHNAMLGSLRASGVDVDALLKKERTNEQKFLEAFAEAVSNKWQQPSSLVQQNLFISTKHFRTDGVAEFAVRCLESLKRSGVVRYGRVTREEFVPGHAHLVVQLLCNAEKF